MNNIITWLNERPEIWEKNRGRWLAIDLENNKVFSDEDLNKAVKEYKDEHPTEEPWIFLVPREDEELLAL